MQMTAKSVLSYEETEKAKRERERETERKSDKSTVWLHPWRDERRKCEQGRAGRVITIEFKCPCNALSATSPCLTLVWTQYGGEPNWNFSNLMIMFSWRSWNKKNLGIINLGWGFLQQGKLKCWGAPVWIPVMPRTPSLLELKASVQSVSSKCPWGWFGNGWLADWCCNVLPSLLVPSMAPKNLKASRTGSQSVHDKNTHRKESKKTRGRKNCACLPLFRCIYCICSSAFRPLMLLFLFSPIFVL